MRAAGRPAAPSGLRRWGAGPGRTDGTPAANARQGVSSSWLGRAAEES